MKEPLNKTCSHLKEGPTKCQKEFYWDTTCLSCPYNSLCMAWCVTHQFRWVTPFKRAVSSSLAAYKVKETPHEDQIVFPLEGVTQHQLDCAVAAAKHYRYRREKINILMFSRTGLDVVYMKDKLTDTSDMIGSDNNIVGAFSLFPRPCKWGYFYFEDMFSKIKSKFDIYKQYEDKIRESWSGLEWPLVSRRTVVIGYAYSANLLKKFIKYAYLQKNHQVLLILLSSWPSSVLALASCTYLAGVMCFPESPFCKYLTISLISPELKQFYFDRFKK